LKAYIIINFKTHKLVKIHIKIIIKLSDKKNKYLKEKEKKIKRWVELCFGYFGKTTE
jgi:hypothetical protein